VSSKRIGQRLILTSAIAATALIGIGCQNSGTSRGPARLPVSASGDINRARALTAQADGAFRDRNFDKADTLYRESLEIFPSQTGAWNNLGNVLMAQQNYVDAQAAFNRAIELEPGRPEPYTSLGRLWLEADYADDSIKHFNEALAIDPRWLPAIRGTSAAMHKLSRATPEYADLLKTAWLIESDEAWLRFFDRERSRVEQALEYEG
jgi:tetratricopeptide (TPR) repeat protein